MGIIMKPLCIGFIGMRKSVNEGSKLIQWCDDVMV